MTYCVGLLVDTGLVMLSDSRTEVFSELPNPNW
jgi:predicted proteasome-type protease